MSGTGLGFSSAIALLACQDSSPDNILMGHRQICLKEEHAPINHLSTISDTRLNPVFVTASLACQDNAHYKKRQDLHLHGVCYSIQLYLQYQAYINISSRIFIKITIFK